MQLRVVSTGNAGPYDASEWGRHTSSNLVGCQCWKPLYSLTVVLNKSGPEFELGHSRGRDLGVS